MTELTMAQGGELAALREREARYRAILECAPEAVVVIDVERLRFVEVNAAAARLLARPREALLDVGPLEVSAERQAGRPAAERLRELLDERVSEHRWVHRTPSGADLACDVRAVRLPVAGAPLVRWTITEVRERERAAAESEERYRHLYTNTPVMMHSIDREGRLVNVSRRWLSVLGYEAEEVLGRRSVEFLTPASAKYAAEVALPDFYRTGSCADVPYQFVKKSGEVIDVLLSATCERAADGSFDRSLAVLVDVTARKRAEEARRASQRLLQQILDNSPTVICVKDEAGRYVTVNHSFERLVRMGREDLVGKLDRDLFPREVADALRAVDAQVVAAGGPVEAEEKVPVDGALRTYLSIKTPVFDDAGAVVGVCGIATDITERTEAERTVRASLREKEVLLKEVHHRVKNNLQVISSLLRLRSRSLEDPCARDVLEEVQHRIRAIALVHEKLYRSRDLARVDARDYVRSLVVDLVRACGLDPRLVRVEVEVDDVHVPLDVAVPLGLLVGELVSNAIKHAFPDGARGRIEVALRAGPSGGLVLNVSDDGVGMPRDLDPARSPTLGLQLVTALAGQLGGTARRIEADRPGTRFEVTVAGGAGAGAT